MKKKEIKKPLKPLIERIKTLDDVLNELGENDQEVMDYRKLQNVKVSEHILGYQEAILITKLFNEGWLPDWDDYNERKYFPWFDMGSSGFRYGDYADWSAHSIVGSRLCFKSRELAIYAGKQFTEVYKKFMII